MATKDRILYLATYLHKHTDSKHPITADQLIEVYRKNHFSTSRNTIRDDINTLIDAHMDIQIETIDRHTSYYVGKRVFSNCELRMLIDAVASAQYINPEQSEQLIEKLKNLAGIHANALLFSGVPVPKTDCAEMENNVNVIMQAICEGKQIRFQYYTYTPTMEKVPRREGEYYTFSPYEIACNDCRYYVIGWHHRRCDISQFRIDLMSNTEMIDEAAYAMPDDFDPTLYGKSVFRMYPGDRMCAVTLKCSNELMTNIIDRFGKPEKSIPNKDGTFTTTVNVSVSNTFFGWLSQFVGGMWIVEPADVRKKYAEFGKKLYEAHCRE